MVLTEPHEPPGYAPAIKYEYWRVAVFVKSEYKITNRNNLKIVTSDTVKVEDLWYEITTTNNETFLRPN